MDVLIADDHPLYRDALGLLVKQLDEIVTTHSVTCYDQVIEHLQQNHIPDLILVDLHMPGMDVWQGMKMLRELCPETPVIVISSSESEEDSQKAIDHGVLGFIPKSLDGNSILNALKLILDNGVIITPFSNRSSIQPTATLTHRQHEVLSQLAKGESNKAIARALGLSEGTVKLHVRAVFNALNVKNRTQAVIEAEKKGLIRDN